MTGPATLEISVENRESGSTNDFGFGQSVAVRSAEPHFV